MSSYSEHTYSISYANSSYGMSYANIVNSNTIWETQTLFLYVYLQIMFISFTFSRISSKTFPKTVCKDRLFAVRKLLTQVS